jgi:uncharacterized protein (TIGR04141 family)
VRGEDELSYNARAAKAGLHLFDRSLVYFEGERGPIEFCDLLTENREIIHVKRKGASSVLSHLFFQGFVSAEAFLEHREFRENIRLDRPEVSHLIPADALDLSEFQVIYALIAETGARLPFFSKVALTAIVRQLRHMRYGIALQWIPFQEDE